MAAQSVWQISIIAAAIIATMTAAISTSHPQEQDAVAILDRSIEHLTSRHQSQHLRLHPVRRHEIFSCISDELRVAWMVDRFYSGYDFRQLGVVKVNVLD